MRKYILLFFLSSILVFAEEYNVYNVQKVFSVAIGDEKGQIPFDWQDDGGPGPRRILFDIEGQLFVSSSQNHKLMLFSKEGVFLTNIPLQPLFAYSYDFYKSSDGFIMYGSSGVSIQDEKGEMKVDIRLKETGQNGEESFYLGSVFFCRLINNTLLSIPNPGPDLIEYNHMILNREETRKLFDKPDKYGLEGVTIDEKNRIFVDGELQTRNYKIFYEYWYVDRDVQTGNDDFSTEKLGRMRNNSYLGKDSKGNVYWLVGTFRVIVLNEGKFVGAFIYDYTKSKTLPAIHPSGDVYFLDYDQSGVYLNRIQNQWDSEGRKEWYNHIPSSGSIKSLN